MKIEIIMPKMGESITEGTIVKWHKKKGDKVQKDEILFEISTDKVDSEIPSPADGVLVEIVTGENETVNVETVVAYIENSAKQENDSGPVEIPSTDIIGGESIDIIMPKMGESVTEGTIVKWYKTPGEIVTTDEILFEITTDKVDTEVPSPADGVLTEIFVTENQTVAVETIVARIVKSGGIVKQEYARESAVESEKVIGEKISAEKVFAEEAGEGTRKDYVSPAVISIMNRENISLSEVKKIRGTGDGGRVTKKDIMNFVKLREVEVSDLLDQESSTPEENTGENIQGIGRLYDGRGEVIKMDNNRRKIMQHMLKSRDTSVHVTEMIDVDMSRIYNYMKKKKLSKSSGEIKLTYTAFVAYASVKAIKDFPLINSSIEQESILMKKNINLGIAIALEPNGLIVPNIKNAEEKSLTGIAGSIADLTFRARSKKLLPEDVAEGTFSITNYGIFGTLFGTPIINQPETAILGMGAVRKIPVVIEQDDIDTIAIKPYMFLSLSHDHRLIDGMLGGKFLARIKEILENFDTKNI